MQLIDQLDGATNWLGFTVQLIDQLDDATN
jgi:hypothetical protein